MEFSLEDNGFPSMIGTMKAEVRSNSTQGTNSCEDEESFYETSCTSALQFRKVVLKACWRDEMGMAEVMEQKGQMLTSMGIVRNGKIYCSIEETLFLAEIGALLLVDDKDTTIPLKKIYEKVAEGKSSCSWDDFEVYRHLKSQGYIVGRHGIRWSMKSVESYSNPLEDTSEASIVPLLDGLHIRGRKPVFDVYPPNSKFRKTSPGDPYFIIHLARDYPPSWSEIEELERQCNDLPLKIGHVEHGRVSIFSFDKVELPLLP